MSVPDHSPYDPSHCEACAKMCAELEAKKARSPAKVESHHRVWTLCQLGARGGNTVIAINWAQSGSGDVNGELVEMAQALAEFEAPLLAEVDRLKIQLLARGCWCLQCGNVFRQAMFLCPDCGNKRCPRANDHRNECTNSNEPGQAGSAF